MLRLDLWLCQACFRVVLGRKQEQVSNAKNDKEIVQLDKLKDAGGYESYRLSAPPCWSPEGKWGVSRLERTKWVPTGRPGMELAYRTTMGLVCASLEKGVEQQIDLAEKGVVFVGSIDWR
jgi:hypothetical protein